jgi:hypothetical protein
MASMARNLGFIAPWTKRAPLTFVAAITVLAAFMISVLAAFVISARDAQAKGGSSAGAKYEFRVSPRVGKPTTTFRVTFRAPFRADGNETDYVLEGVGPPRCASLFEFSGPVRRGDRAVMKLTPANDIILPSSRQRWCRGSYVGYVYYQTPGLQPNKFIGYFSFGVGRIPVSLAG